MKQVMVLVAIALSTACTLPHTTVSTGMSSPTLIVSGAPSGSVLFVDGLDMGVAAQYNGNPKVLAVLEGTHQVEVRLGANIVHRERAFVSNGQSHTVAVAGAVSP